MGKCDLKNGRKNFQYSHCKKLSNFTWPKIRLNAQKINPTQSVSLKYLVAVGGVQRFISLINHQSLKVQFFSSFNVHFQNVFSQTVNHSTHFGIDKKKTAPRIRAHINFQISPPSPSQSIKNQKSSKIQLKRKTISR